MSLLKDLIMDIQCEIDYKSNFSHPPDLEEVIEDCVSGLFNSKIEKIIFEYGINKALKHFDDNYGLDSLPHDPSQYCMSILLSIVKKELGELKDSVSLQR